MPSGKVRTLFVVQVIAGLLILILRIVELPAASLWQDLISWFSIFWIILVCGPDPRVRSRVTLLFMTSLLGIYGIGQLPLLLRILEFL